MESMGSVSGAALAGQWLGLKLQTGKDVGAPFVRPPQRGTGRTREVRVTLAAEWKATVTGKAEEICAPAKKPMGRMPSSSLKSPPSEVFEGLKGRGTPVDICKSRNLPPAMSLEEAMTTLRTAIGELEAHAPPFASGTLRFQVPLPPDLRALQWLQSQPHHPALLPRSYFSPREIRDTGSGQVINGTPRQFLKLDPSGVGGVAGIGAAVLFNGSKSFSFEDWNAIKRFLSKRHPLIRAYGAMRFDPNVEPSHEWKPFGSFYFFIPQIEFCECQGCSLLAVTLVWDEARQWPFIVALRKALTAMQMVSNRICPDSERSLAQVLHREHIPNEQSWHEGLNKTVGSLKDQQVGHSNSVQQGSLDPSSQDPPALSKVVMARRTKLEMNGQLDPVSLLACLQDKDPSAYQFVVQVPDGSAFIGNSPERLFARNELLVASEAVAGTRARGSTRIRDLQLGMDLMESAKDHIEFEIVRESVKHHMEAVCEHVETETAKGLLKQARVQHLYARFNGELHSESGEYDILSALHPTPAVCGHPQAEARESISANEAFDRGLYAGPVGWFGGNGAEFAVGIRSSLIQPLKSNKSQNEFYSGLSDKTGNWQASSFGSEKGSSPRQYPRNGTCMFLYVGVGVVKDSISSAEWSELELKTSLFESLLEQRQPLEKVVNINALWAKLIVEECCRLGITYFCVAPGSRSSPIATSAAANPRVTCVSCIDERSMAYHALGYGRGANKAAAVITSSGTAVSNLFPAVVEASQDFVPLVILTADRPAELFDSGANQAIDQGKHFGGFVRYHANLPAADDNLPARLVLTTIDTAVNRAMITPPGPVHINCQFREPLASAPRAWSTECLKGLSRWAVASSPYTQYFASRPRLLGGAPPMFQTDFSSVGELIGNAREGLLVVGGLSAAEETWAVALLAQHLGWPVIPDVISGLRIGEALFTPGVTGRKVNVIHNFDQILLSKDVAERIKPDVVLQIGSVLTSKRLAQFLEAANLQAYVLVEEHSSRHDPSHIVTHRIQSCTADFAFTTMKVTEPKPPTAICTQLQYLSKVAEQEIRLKLKAEPSLTEPLVARCVVSCLPLGCAVFLGNSMPIRDVDMYSHGALKTLGRSSDDGFLGHSVAQIGSRVGANRGASGIDGVLSTAIGFAAGSRQRVTLLLGDVSFLHDTNGLSFLSERPGQPPVTVVVVNNGGGGIFSFLPIADLTPEDTFTPLFSTPHAVDLKKLCQAHRVCHWLIKSKEELRKALESVNGSPLHWVIEVQSKIDKNANFHRFLNSAIGPAVTQAFNTVSQLPAGSVYASDPGLKIVEVKIARHSFPLLAPPTSRRQHCTTEIMRDGFLLRVALVNGSSGLGEIAPLRGVSKENLLDVEEQLRVIAEKMRGLTLVRTLALLDGSFSQWLSKSLGLQENTIFPTVRAGVEMAVLGALAASHGCSLSELLSDMGRAMCSKEIKPGNAWNDLYGSVRVCALLDSESSSEDAGDAAAQLVQNGFCTLKLKVGRRTSPLDDAEMVKRVRERVGPAIDLRADANRKWSYKEAVDFANAVKSCRLQYLEEPVQNPLDIPRYCEETGMFVALDETLEDDLINIEDRLPMYACPGLVAVVIKAGCVGGFEKAWLIARWAQRHGILVVISSAFESSISLAAYSQFAAYVDEHANSPTTRKVHGAAKVAHGLGTYKWLQNDDFSLRCVKSMTSSIEISVPESAKHLQRICHTVESTMPKDIGRQNVTSYNIKVNVNGAFSFHVTETASAPLVGRTPTVIFLHGFMGRGEDWLPTMDGLSATLQCISVDIPGHGQTVVEEVDLKQPRLAGTGVERDASTAQTYETWSMEGLGAALAELITKLDQRKVILVGYSMGARIAMYMALKHTEQVSAAVIVSGSPGLQNASARRKRTSQDNALAESLRRDGLQSFVDKWYRQPLWKSLQAHPAFEGMKRSRLQQQDPHSLAKSLVMISSGRQPSLWEELRSCRVPLLLVVGELDTKFQGIADEMLRACESGQQPYKGGGSPTETLVAGSRTDRNRANGFLPQLLKVEDAGHAVHIENPLRLVKAIREFILSTTSWNSTGRDDDT